MYPIITYQAIFLATYKSNWSQVKDMVRRGGGRLDAGCGSMQRVFNCCFQTRLVLYDLLKISCCFNEFVAGMGLGFAPRRSVTAAVAASQLAMLVVQGWERRRTLRLRGRRHKAVCIAYPPAELHH